MANVELLLKDNYIPLSNLSSLKIYFIPFLFFQKK